MSRTSAVRVALVGLVGLAGLVACGSTSTPSVFQSTVADAAASPEATQDTSPPDTGARAAPVCPILAGCYQNELAMPVAFTAPPGVTFVSQSGGAFLAFDRNDQSFVAYHMDSGRLSTEAPVVVEWKRFEPRYTRVWFDPYHGVLACPATGACDYTKYYDDKSQPVALDGAPSRVRNGCIAAGLGLYCLDTFKNVLPADLLGEPIVSFSEIGYVGRETSRLVLAASGKAVRFTPGLPAEPYTFGFADRLVDVVAVPVYDGKDSAWAGRTALGKLGLGIGPANGRVCDLDVEGLEVLPDLRGWLFMSGGRGVNMSSRGPGCTSRALPPGAKGYDVYKCGLLTNEAAFDETHVYANPPQCAVG